MKGFWKGVVALAAVAGVGYVGFKGYQRVSEIMKLSKSLPNYLEDLLEEKPKININMRLKALSIAVGMTAELYEKNNICLEEHILQYIEDYYPLLAKLNITVSEYIKADGHGDDDEDDCDDHCCSSKSHEDGESCCSEKKKK